MPAILIFATIKVEVRISGQPGIERYITNVALLAHSAKFWKCSSTIYSARIVRNIWVIDTDPSLTGAGPQMIFSP